MPKKKNDQQNNIGLIALENVVSQGCYGSSRDYLDKLNTLKATGTIPLCMVELDGGRCGESLAIERAKEIFRCKICQCQPHSRAKANFLAAYMALIEPGDYGYGEWIWQQVDTDPRSSS